MASAFTEPEARRVLPPGSDLSDIRYEIIGEDYVEKPPMGVFEVALASLLLGHLEPFARTRGLGRVVSELLFDLRPAVDRNLRPDLAFVSAGRWPLERPLPRRVNAWPVVPDLAIEVVSPSNPAGEAMEKVRDYFAAGVRRVWVIYPEQLWVYDYPSPTGPRVLTLADTLEGCDIMPGFRLGLAELFRDLDASLIDGTGKIPPNGDRDDAGA